MKLEEYEIINGKPYGGHWYGSSILINQLLSKDFEKEPIFIQCIERLKNIFPKGFELRKENIIYRPPLYCDPFNQVATLGIKALVWGRAYKVMKLTAIGKKSYKKKYVSGRRKKVRVI